MAYLPKRFSSMNHCRQTKRFAVHPKRARAAFAALLLPTVLATLSVTSAAQAAGATLVVNVGSPFRPVTHVAAGGLYALAENSRPADSTLLPLHLNTLTQPPPGVGQ